MTTIVLLSTLLVALARSSTQPTVDGTTGTTPSPPKLNRDIWIGRGSLNPGHYVGSNLYVVRAGGPLYLSCEVHHAKKTTTLKWFRETDAGVRTDMGNVDYARQAVSASKYVGVTEFSLTFKNFTKEFVGNKFTCEAYENGKKVDAREHVLVLEKAQANNEADALPTTGSTPSH